MLAPEQSSSSAVGDAQPSSSVNSVGGVQTMTDSDTTTSSLPAKMAMITPSPATAQQYVNSGQDSTENRQPLSLLSLASKAANSKTPSLLPDAECK